jgi:outer membrane protein TolC
MLIGVFELLADAREQIAAVQGANEALRDYWLAMADLQQALGGALPAADRNAPEPAIPPAPAPARGHEEHRHD